jgi:benzylsuccinate CoA-transferase BbsF subunit
MKDALDGVKVVQFGGYAAGPYIGKYLANFGASVVHVESRDRPDGFRLQYPPYKDGQVGLNRSGCFAYFGDSKCSVTLDLKSKAGAELGYKLTDWADIVIENMRPGTLARLGFGYDVLQKRNPSLILLSTSNMGQTGPYATQPGFGTQLSSLSGFTNLTGEPDGPPCLLYGPYIDFIAVAYGGAAVLAALDHRRRTKEGVHIDLSQYEAGLQFISGALLNYDANGVIAGRDGNRDPKVAPHGCFPCRDSMWCAISCWDESEWERFCHAAGQAAWLADPRFQSCADRKSHEPILNQLISAWTRNQHGDSLMRRLQDHGVHAGVVNTMRDLFSDSQIQSRNVWQELEHAEIGRQHYRMVSYDLSETPGKIRRPAPCLGEHNEEVFRKWIGLSEKDYTHYQEEGAFS